MYVNLKQNIGTKIIMSKCLDHKTKRPDTHRHFRLATGISRKCPIVCRGLELKKSNVQKQICLDAEPISDHLNIFVFRKKDSGPPM